MSDQPQSIQHKAQSEVVGLLPRHPPPLIIRTMASTLLAFFATILVVAFTVHIGETVRCPFILVPEQGTDPIQSPHPAVVHEVSVTDGQEVAAGAVLFVLRSDEIRKRHTEAETLAADLLAWEERSRKLEEAFQMQLSIKTAEIVQVEREVSYRRKHTETSQDLLDRTTKLAADGLVSQVELMGDRLVMAASQKDLAVAEKALQQVTLQKQTLESDRSRQRSEEQSEMGKLKLRVAALRQELEQSEGDLILVRAPYAAVVLALAQRNRGTVVQAGQELCQLARLEARPHARLILSESSLSRLSAKQRMRFFFDAFPYQRYGSVTGMLQWLSPASINSSQGPQFIALASLDQFQLVAKGQALPLRVGMKGEARIHVGSRTLVEYAFEPLRQIRENMRP